MSDVSVFLSNHPTALKDFAGPVATIFAASVAAYIALRLSKGQLAIAKSQTEIARDNPEGWQARRWSADDLWCVRPAPGLDECRSYLPVVDRTARKHESDNNPRNQQRSK
jgi:hypothetical protein